MAQTKLGQPRWRAGIKAVGLTVAGVVVVLLVVELALRAYFTWFGTLTDRVMYVYSAQEILEASPGFTGLPFVGFGPSANGLGHNRLGYRNHEVEIAKPAGVFRIAATGGSTTYGAGVAPDETWPAQLERILHEQGYTQVEVINTASTAYTTWNSLANFAFRVVDLQPDLLMVYHATNDAKARLTPPDCYTGATPIRGLYDGQWRTNGPDLGPSTVWRYLAIGRGWMPNPIDLNNWVLPVEASIGGCPGDGMYTEAELLALNPPIFFERNLRNLVHLARANGTEVLLSTWAYYPPLIETDLWRQTFDEMNAVTQQVAQDMDTLFYDLMANLPQDEALWHSDGEHQKPAGTAEQARQYAAYLIASGVLPAPQPTGNSSLDAG
jgi:lysophospholipase L1-like esterase